LFIKTWQIQIDWELLVQCLEAFLSFLLFPRLCRTRSIHFVLLNYLIRTHPSRWASWRLINLIPAFIHPALSDRVVPSFHFPFPRDRFLHPSAVSLISFFLSYTSRQSMGNRNESQDLRSHRFWKVHGSAPSVQFPDITSLRT